MFVTDQQEKCVQILMYKLDHALDDLLTFGDQEGDWLTLLDTKLDQGATLLETASAGVTLGIALIPVTGGASLAVSGVFGTIAAGITVAKAANGCLQWLHSGDATAPFPEDEAALATFKLSLHVGLMEVADAIVVYYSHVMNEVMEESSIPIFAQYAAQRVMKKLKEELKRQLKEHKDPKLALKVMIAPEVFIDYLMQSTTLSTIAETISIKKEYCTANVFGSREMPVKWAFSRARIALLMKGQSLELGFYATPNERRYGMDTTLPYYGYVMPQLVCDATKTIAINNRILGLLPNHEEISSHVRAHLTRNYLITWDDVSAYLASLSIEKKSLNQYLTDRDEICTIAVCHDNTLIGRSLKGGDYSHVNFRYAHLEGCDLEDTIWDGARLAHTFFNANKINQQTSFKGAFLEFSQLTKFLFIGNWEGARLNAAVLNEGVFSSDRFQDTNINWEWATMSHMQMEDRAEKLTTELDIKLEHLREEYIGHKQEEVKEKEALIAWQKRQEAVVVEQAQINQTIFQEIESIKNHAEVELSKKIHEHLNALYDLYIPQPYVELYAQPVGGMDKQPVLIWNRLSQFLQNKDEFAYFLEGALGCGKTDTLARFVLENSGDVNHHHTSFSIEPAEYEGWTMFVLPLWKVKDLSEGDLLDSSLKKFLPLEQIERLKKRKCLFVLDGLDECGVNINNYNILENIYQTRDDWEEIKIVVTATSDFVAQMKDFPERLRFAEGLPFPAESQGRTLPLSEQQIKTYFELYFPRGISLSDPEFNNIYPVRELYKMAQDPIMAHIICEVFSGKGLNHKLPETPGAFCKVFMEQWYQHVKSKAQSYQYHFQQMDILIYIRKIALQMFAVKQTFIERTLDTEKSLLQIKLDERKAILDPDSFAFIFTDPEWKQAGTITPLSVTVNQDSLPIKIRHAFRHKFFYFFALGLELIDILEHNPVEISINAWNHNYITDELIYKFMQDALIDQCKAAPYKKSLFLKSLCGMVTASITDESKKFAASNAITFLKHLDFDFKNAPIAKTWQGIRVPYADLSHAKISGLDWSAKSNFEHVRFYNAEMAGMNLHDIEATGARFVSDASLHHYIEGRPKVVAKYLADKDIITYSLPVSAGSRAHKIMNQGLDGTTYPSFEGHQKEILCMQWGANGLISGSTRGTIYLWSLQGKKIKTFKCDEKKYIYDLSWYANGNLFASGGEDHFLRVWDLEKNACTFVADDGFDVRCVLFGQSKPILLSGGDSKKLRVWTFTVNGLSLSEKQPVIHLEKKHDSAIYSCALSPNENHAVVGCKDGTLQIHKLGVARAIHDEVFAHKLLGHKGTVKALVWNKQNHAIISGGEDSTIRVWDPRTGLYISVFYGDGSSIDQLHLLADGRRMIAGQDRILSIWEIDSSAVVSHRKQEILHRVTCIVAHLEYIITGHADGSVFLWNVQNPSQKTITKIMQHDAPIKQVDVSHNGQYIASLDNHHEIRVHEYNFQMHQAVPHEEHWGVIQATEGMRLNQLSWLADGPASPHCWLAVAASDGCIHIWTYNVSAEEWRDTKQLNWSLDDVDHEIQFIVKQNTHTQFAAASDKTFKVWDLLQDTEAPIYTGSGHKSSIVSMVWSPDHRFLATLDDAQTLLVWDTVTWQQVFKDSKPSDEKQALWRFYDNKQWLMVSTLEDIRSFEVLDASITKQGVKLLTSGAERCLYHQEHLYLVDKKSIDVMRFASDDLVFVTRFGEGICARNTNLLNVKTLKPDELNILEIHGARVRSTTAKKNNFWEWGFFKVKERPTTLPPMMIKPHISIPEQRTESLRILHSLTKSSSIWSLNEDDNSQNESPNRGKHEDRMLKIDITALSGIRGARH